MAVTTECISVSYTNGCQLQYFREQTLSLIKKVSADISISNTKLTEVLGTSETLADTPETSSQDLQCFIVLSSLGIEIFRKLDELLPLPDYRDYAIVTVSLATFSDKRDQWTSGTAFTNATYLLAKYNLLVTKPCVLVDHVLRELIRPLFAKSNHPEVTAQGRKALHPSPRIHGSSLLEAETKPWKFGKIYSVTVFRWVLLKFAEALVEANWPLVIPPILTLIDDDSPEYKAKGCELLAILLRVTPPALLVRTGLGEVFYDAVMPCLSYLPSLTPQDQSLRLLGDAYPTLITLSRLRYPSDDKRKERVGMLDQVMRKGVLNGYFHCSDNVKIVESLVSQMRLLVSEMGIWSVKHLKDMIPMLSDILSEPFATAYPPLLITTIQTLQTIILTDWPRIAAHRAEVLRGLTFCWLKLMEDGPKVASFNELKQGLKDSLKLLKAAVQNEVDIDADVKLLSQSDERLAELLISE
ncbi:hypothetical protein GP486_000909 [Trichoglossum hirsutum]|uniref:TELO2-interacting protein 2 n=1 Tax=Trichoglossum hirsutum TaxID=265104 RepID=A0A9P8LGX5_9PEZI|nr:hypothetical protein GP486_000909 [Trichoglossum hirsutum]